MRWDLDAHHAAVTALHETLSVKEAAARLGCSPGALREGLRRRMTSPREIIAKAIYRHSTKPVKAARLPKASSSARRVAGPPPKSLPPFERADDAKVYVVVSDVHVPYQNQKACDAVGDLMRDLRPDGLVVNGDFLDLLEVSRHATASVAQLEGLRISKSFDGGNEQLDRWQKAGGPQMKDNHFVDGNHEDRLRRWIASGDNAVWLGDESTSIAKRLRFKERGFAYHEGYPKAHVKLGHLLVTHGRWCNKYAAATHMDRYGHAILVGHVHASGMHRGSALDKQKAGYVQGHLGDVNSVAMSYAPVPNNWANGFSVVTVEPNGNFHVQLLDFVDGAFYFGGRRYGARARA